MSFQSVKYRSVFISFLIVSTVLTSGIARAEVGRLDDIMLAAWGWNSSGQCDVPAGTDFAQVAGGWYHSLALKSDGSLAAWGRNDEGQCNVPTGTDFTQIAGGTHHSLALKLDGSLAAWGVNSLGQCDVPAGTDFTQVAEGGLHSLALKSDGSLAAWGHNGDGQCNVPTGTDFTQVAGGQAHSLALKSDGSLAAWGWNSSGQCDVPAGTDFAQVAGGGAHSLALKSDGSLAAWGENTYGQCDVPTGTNFTQVAGGWYHSLALKSDGSLASWGLNFYGQCDVPAQGYFLDIAAGNDHSLALQARTSYDDLLISGGATLLQRSIDVASDVTIESMMEMTGSPTMTVAGRTTVCETGGIRGAGTVAGRVYAEYGSQIQATGNLTIGDASRYTGFFSDGNLEVGKYTVTIQSKSTAAAGKLISIDSGTLSVENGMIVEPGCRLVGYGIVNGRLINQGLVAAGFRSEDLTFNDLVSGAGSFTGSIIFNGGYSPGNSPTVQHFDWAEMTENNTLTMEIGGLTAGEEYDQLIGKELLTLGGTLNLALINGFMPGYGNAFTLFAGPLSGQFDEVLLPELDPGLQWYDSQLVTSGMLIVTTDGDIDQDGDVDDVDLCLLLSGFDSTPSLQNNGDLDALLGNFGRTDMAGDNSVPEPHTALLLAMGMIGMTMRFRRRRK